MTAVSLNTAKQTGLMIPLNVLVRAALAEVISNGKNNMPPFQGELKPGSNPRLGYPFAPQ
jgi:hypothetical protein